MNQQPQADGTIPMTPQPTTDDYRQLIESFAQAVWEASATGQIVGDSPSWRAYTGQTTAQWLGEGWTNAVHPHQRQAVLAQWRQAVIDKTPVQADYQLQHAQGGWRWTSVRAAPVFNPDGSVRKWIGLNMDITDRKQAEETKRQTQARLQLALDVAELGTWSWNLLTNEGYLDSRGTELIGLPIGPMADVAHAQRSRIHPDDQGRIEAAIYAAIANGTTATLAYRVNHPDGRLRHIVSRARMIADEAGQPLEMVGTNRDVTAEHQLTTALRQSEAQYRTLFESIDQGFCLIEVLFDQQQQPYDHRFLQVNPAFERLTGLKDLVGQTASDRSPQVAAHWHELYARVITSGQPLRCEQRSPLLDRIFDVYICPLVDVTRRLVSVVFTDITDRKQAELVRHDAARRKDEFLAMLAHELRNPMAILSGTLALLSAPTGPPQTLSLDQALGLMSREVTHLARLVDDLLEVSRISRGQIELRLEPVDLVDLVQQSLIAMHPQFMARQQVLFSELSHQPLWVQGDASRLTQIVRNLLSNAHKYTPGGGLIQVRLQAQAGQVVLRVKDTGIGLAADQQEPIFEAFVQVATSLDRPQGGLGLGLAVVKQLVERHGGHVRAYSPGLSQGSEFTVTLSQIDPPRLIIRSPAPSQGASQAPSRPVRLLVVDDNADLARVTALVLADHHYQVHTCLSGEEALDVVMEWLPDVVLLDLGMPGMNGYETCRRLRQLGWGQRGLIVALSGYGSQQDKQRTQAAGFDGHLLKPLVVATLKQLLIALGQPSVAPEAAPQPRAAEVVRQEAHDLRSAFGLISAAVSRLQTEPDEPERAELLAMMGRQVEQAAPLVAALLA